MDFVNYKQPIYMGKNTCYGNASFQLLTSIPEFNDIFNIPREYILTYDTNTQTNKPILKSIYMGIQYTGDRQLLFNANLTDFFEALAKIVKLITTTKKLDSDVIDAPSQYKIIYDKIGIPSEITEFHSARDLIYNLIDILAHVNIPEDHNLQKALRNKIDMFINKTKIALTETKMCKSDNTPKQIVDSSLYLLELKTDTAGQDLMAHIYTYYYGNYIEQTGMIEGCGDKQRTIECAVAALDSSNNTIKCKQFEPSCIVYGEKYYDEHLKEVKYDTDYLIKAKLTSNNKKEIKSVLYGENTYGEYVSTYTIKTNDYLIIALPTKLSPPNNTVIHMNYDAEIDLNDITYKLDSSIFHTGSHYVYQIHDGTAVIHTYNDNTHASGDMGYNSKSGENTAILLYKKKGLDIIKLRKPLTTLYSDKDSMFKLDKTIVETAKEYCKYRNKITVYGNIYKGGKSDYSHYITQYPNALLIINDNFIDSFTDSNGAGNASNNMRQHNIYSFFKHNKLRPCIAGITTGLSSGKEYIAGTTLNTKLSDYKYLTPKHVIDNEIKIIKYIMIVWGYTEIIYSSESNGILGSGIFKIPQDIKDYITHELWKLGTKHYFIEGGEKTKEKIQINKYINILN